MSERAISGAPTSIAAFVGATKSGAVNEPARCVSFKDFERQFGGLDHASDVGYAVHQFFANGGTDAIVVRIDGGCERTSAAVHDAMHALGREQTFNVLCLPGLGDATVLLEAAKFCTERRAFFIADVPAAVITPDDALALISSGALPKSDHAAVYYPWIHVDDPLSRGRLRPVPPSGTVAGVYARVDSTEGVWRSPAGAGFPLVGVAGQAYALRDDESGSLNARGINAIRTVRASGSVLWGARTLAGDFPSSESKYIPVRRTALYIEESLRRGLQWAVFEPNAEPLWAGIRQHVDAFLLTMFRQGAFQGTKPEDGYFVKCGMDTTTQNDIDQGITNIIVGFAPLKPAEFVIIKLQQLAGNVTP